MANVSFKIL